MEELLDFEQIPYYNQDLSAKSAISLFYSMIKNKPEQEVIKDLIITKEILLKKEPHNLVLKNSIDFFLTNLHPNNLMEISKNKKEKIFSYFEKSKQELINNLDKKLNSNSVIFVHSINNLIYESLKKITENKKLQINVLNCDFSDTFSKKMSSKANIKIFEPLEIKKALKSVDFCLFGCEGIIKNKAIAKKGSEILSEYIKKQNCPLYVLTHSLKHTSDNIFLNENSGYEVIESEKITSFICEYGILKPEHIEQEINFHISKIL
ncbi:MAG: hypothetical protein QXM96_02805 [Candidatus Woesearchaeota archaeon]